MLMKDDFWLVGKEGIGFDSRFISLKSKKSSFVQTQVDLIAQSRLVTYKQ